jgi:hypothetical protein
MVLFNSIRHFMDTYEMNLILSYFLLTVTGIAVGICAPRFLLPLQEGLKLRDQRLVRRGMIYIMITVFGMAIIIYGMTKVL